MTPASRRPCLVLFAAVAALAAGCGGSDDDASPAASPAPAPAPAAASLSGRFIDAAVSNLGFACSGAAGFADSAGNTDAQGRFNYAAGQTCVFSAGGVRLGSAPGAGIVTPVSLVAGATPGTPNAQVTNIVRFLLTLDDDGNAANGIALGTATVAALAGKTLDFAGSGFDTAAAALLAAAAPGRTLASAAAAEAHLTGSLTALYAGAYACTYRAVVSGVDTLLGNVAITVTDGVIAGSGTPLGGGSAFEVSGAVSASGAASLSAGSTSTGATFTGSFTTQGSAATTRGSGTWNDPGLGSGTWSCQHG